MLSGLSLSPKGSLKTSPNNTHNDLAIADPPPSPSRGILVPKDDGSAEAYTRKPAPRKKKRRKRDEAFWNTDIPGQDEGWEGPPKTDTIRYSDSPRERRRTKPKLPKPDQNVLRPEDDEIVDLSREKPDATDPFAPVPREAPEQLVKMQDGLQRLEEDFSKETPFFADFFRSKQPGGLLSVAGHQARENRRPTPPLPDYLEPEDLSTWKARAWDAAKLEIFTTLTRSGDDKAPKTATLNIAATQRLIVANGQQIVANEVAQLYDEKLNGWHPGLALSNLSKFIYAHCKLVSYGRAEYF